MFCSTFFTGQALAPTQTEDKSRERAKELSGEVYNALSGIENAEDLVDCLQKIPLAINSTPHSDGQDEYCTKAITIIVDIEEPELVSLTYNQLYLLFYNDGNFDSATIAAEKSLSIADKIEFLEMQARGNQNFAILSSVKGRYVKAIEYFLESEKYYKQLGDDSALSRVYGNMGVTFEQAGNLEKAYEYMLKELAMTKEIGNESFQAYSMANIGAVHSSVGRKDSALHYYEASLELAKRLGDDDLTITNLDNIGAYYSESNDYNTATSYLMSAYELAEKTGFQYQKIYITNNLAKNYTAIGRLDSAEKYAEMQLDLALDFEFLYDQQLAYSNLSKIYVQQNDFEKAYQTHSNYAKVKDSLLNRDRINELENLRERYEAEQREQQIEMLTLQTATAESRRNTYLIAGLLITFVLLSLYIGQRYKSKKNRQLLEKEKEVAEMKSNFFSNISHEFRTPLTLISGPIEMLKEKISHDQTKKQLDVMEKNADRLLSLINQLLDLSRLESGKLDLSTEPTDMVTLVRGVTMTFQSLAEMEDISLAVKTDFSSFKMDADREKVETILINLVNNAFDYTPEGGSITVSLEINQKGEGKPQCRISVKDTGEGIAKEDLPKVFDRFYRGSTERKTAETGSGIGLALTKELVELHGSKIEVFSEVKGGTEFTVTIPAENVSYKESRTEEYSVAVSSPSTEAEFGKQSEPDVTIESKPRESSKPILLLIEDNEDVINYLKDILGDSYRVLEAMDGKQGLEAAFEYIPDLIISDVMMPKMDGFQVAETLKQNQKTSHIPLILLTAKAEQEDKMQGLKAHADEYLTKPFRPEELRLRIQNMLESSRKLKEKYKREFMIRPGSIEVQSMDEAFLLRVREVVDKHLGDEDFTVEQFGEEVGMSRSQLHRKLSALIDQSASEFMRSYRLHRAKDMISQNAGSISEISFAVGFGSPSYFSKCFREEFGTTPSEVKEKV